MNILLYHGLMIPQGLPHRMVAPVLWLLVFAAVRSTFAGVLTMKMVA